MTVHEMRAAIRRRHIIREVREVVGCVLLASATVFALYGCYLWAVR